MKDDIVIVSAARTRGAFNGGVRKPAAHESAGCHPRRPSDRAGVKAEALRIMEHSERPAKARIRPAKPRSRPAFR